SDRRPTTLGDPRGARRVLGQPGDCAWRGGLLLPAATSREPCSRPPGHVATGWDQSGARDHRVVDRRFVARARRRDPRRSDGSDSSSPPSGAPRRGHGRLMRRAWHAAAAYLALAIVTTWPLIRGLGRDVPADLGDPVFVMWALAWDCQQLLAILRGDFARLPPLFTPHIFQPLLATAA